jgi:cytochrome c
MLAVLAAPVALAGCGDRLRPIAAALDVPGGDPAQGRRLMRSYGCVDCHMIPGVRGANALVGPPLTHWAHRVYIAGRVPNTPENLVTWLQNPRLIHPESAMPNMGVPVDHAGHMAAYLYTIR